MFHFSKIIAAAAVAAALAVPAWAQTQQIRIQNNSGVTLQYLYFSRSDTDSWEEDRLGANVLQSGRYIDLVIVNVSNCIYDVLLQFENGAEYQDQIDVCQIGTYNIN